MFVVDGVELTPVTGDQPAAAGDAPGGLRACVVRRYLDDARAGRTLDLDHLALECLGELDDLEH